MEKKTFEVNQNASLKSIGTLIYEAIVANEGGNTDTLRDILLEVHGIIYPNASRPATPEENAAIAAAEPPPCEFYRTGTNGTVRDLAAEMLNKERAAQEPPAWTPCMDSDCDTTTCNRCDCEGKIENPVSNKILVHKVFLKGLVEDLDRATSLIDVTTQYLQDSYDNKQQVMTPFQLASILELVDSALMEQRERFQEIIDCAKA